MRSVVSDTLDIGIVYKQRTIDETIDVALKRFGESRSSGETAGITPPEPQEDALGSHQPPET